MAFSKFDNTKLINNTPPAPTGLDETQAISRSSSGSETEYAGQTPVNSGIPTPTQSRPGTPVL